VLFTFPSRYWFTIGRVLVFSLRRWSSQIQTRLLVPRLTRVPARRKASTFRIRSYYALWRYFPEPSATCWFCNFPGRLQSSPSESHDPLEATLAGLTLQRFRLLRFRSPLLTQSNFFLFLRVLRWFTSPGSLFQTYGFSLE
jgi:hypothetical protein